MTVQSSPNSFIARISNWKVYGEMQTFGNNFSLYFTDTRINISDLNLAGWYSTRFRCMKKALMLFLLAFLSFYLGWSSVRSPHTHGKHGKNVKLQKDFKEEKVLKPHKVSHPKRSQNLTNLKKYPLPVAKRKRPWVILATTNNAFLDFTRNWLESLKRCGVHHVTIVAEDSRTREVLRNIKGIDVNLLMTNGSDLPVRLLKFGSEDYIRLVNKRPAYILSFLRRGIDVLFSDVDTVWLKNPSPFFTGDYDAYFERDIYNNATRPDMICAGFAYYSATNVTTELISKWMQLISAKPKIPDQQLLNQLLRRKTVRQSLKVKYLDPRQFPNGRDYFNATWRRQNANVPPIVVHNNWIKGYDVKIQRFKKVGMWYL